MLEKMYSNSVPAVLVSSPSGNCTHSVRPGLDRI